MYLVKIHFADKYNNAIIYCPGDKFSSDDKERLQDLLNRGLIEGVFSTPSFDSLTKKEIIEVLQERGIKFNPKQAREELLKLIKGA